MSLFLQEIKIVPAISYSVFIYIWLHNQQQTPSTEVVSERFFSFDPLSGFDYFKQEIKTLKVLCKSILKQRTIKLHLPREVNADSFLVKSLPLVYAKFLYIDWWVKPFTYLINWF